MRTGSLGIIYVCTHRDSKVEWERVYKELGECNLPDWFVVQVDGDVFHDLSQCLNIGIDKCIAMGAEYIHWVHNDFHYDDPDWFFSLKNTLEAFPRILKICSSNSRDPIGTFRIGQEQSWLMRASDFTQYPFLYFDERFIRCGGCEDYMEHLNILSRAFLVCITPECTIYHEGAQTRSKYDTNQHQLRNQQTFGEVSLFGQLIEVHDKKYFGCVHGDRFLAQLLLMIPLELRKVLGLENFAGDSARVRLPSGRTIEFLQSTFSFRYGNNTKEEESKQLQNISDSYKDISDCPKADS